MKEFFVEEFSSQESYRRFIKYMLSHSQFFSLVYFRAEMECFDWLIQVPGLYEWDYPYAPMDLCFYRDGYCWFSLTAHEQTACLYTDKEEELKELAALGAELTFSEDNVSVEYCDFLKKEK